MNRRSKRSLVTLVVLAGLAGALYASAPTLLAIIAVRALTGVVDVRKLDIESVGLTRVEVTQVSVSSGETKFEARHAVLRYDPWPFRVREVDIAHARLSLPPASSGGTGGAPGAPAVPAPPPFPLRIADLTVEADTPWGAVTIPASIQVQPGVAGGVEADIRSPGFTASLDNPEPDRQTLTLRDAGGSELLSLGAALNGGYPLPLDGRIDAGKTMQWIQSSEVLPQGLKHDVAPFGVEGGDMRFDGTVQRNLDFSIRLRGRMVVHDRRDDAARLFTSLEIRADSGYAISRAEGKWSGSGDASFDLALDSETAFRGRSPAWGWDDQGLDFSAAEAVARPPGLMAGSIDVTVAAFSDAGASGRIHAQGVRMPDWPQGLADYDADGEWSWHGSSLEAGGNAGGQALPRLSWHLDSKGDRGAVEITSHQPLAELAPTLQPYVQSIARELKIERGDLSARFRVQWTADGTKAELGAGAGPVDADLDEMEIRGMKVAAHNQDDALDRFALSASAPSLKLGAGAVAENLELKLRLALPQIHVDAARLHLLGGDIVLRPTAINLNDDQFVLLADIDSVSLEKVMEIFDLESTELTGRVTGPVRVLVTKAGGLEINQGDLHSTGPGVLRFSVSADSGAGSQLDNIALRALRNFQYKELSASLLYKPDGEYRISARIVGNNPDVLGGHPIALNPTISGRLPALFRAFFVTGDFDRAIMETLQRERSLSTPEQTPSLQGN